LTDRQVKLKFLNTLAQTEGKEKCY
jgi:hypothetical protein